MEYNLPEWAKLLITIGGTAMTIFLGYIASGTKKVIEQQNDHKVDMAEVKTDMSHIKEKVNSIHDWRTELQREQVRQDKEYIAELERRLRERPE